MKTRPAARVQLALKCTGAVAVIAYCLAGGAQVVRDHWLMFILVVALEAIGIFQPFSVNHRGARREFTPDLIAVAAASLLLPTRAGALAIPLGAALGYVVLRREIGLVHLDDVAGYAVGNFLALSVAHLIGQPGLGVNSIVAAAVAVVLYDVITLLMFTISRAAQNVARFWLFLIDGLALSVILWPWLISLGILVGVVGLDAPWALPLMAAPLALIFMASRSRVEATQDRTRLDGLLKATTDILASTTTDGVIDAAGSSIAAIFGCESGRMDVNEPGPSELGVRLSSERLSSCYLIAPARPAMVFTYTDGDRRLLETIASVTASAYDKAALHEDVTEQATRDALTGLVNRRAFEAELASGATGKRAGDTAGVMFLDLDGFKKINDEHGHKAGDEVLVETAQRLLESVRDTDTVARLGGDEFTVLLRGVHNKDEAIIVAERILTAMRKPMRLSSGVDVHPTPSLGIALAAEHNADSSTLLKDADTAMYEAKRAGKDCWRLAHDEAKAAI